MPQMGETVTEGTVTVWQKAVGDRIEVDDALCEISTDKVDSELPSPVAGVLREILVPEGTTVDIGAPLAVVDPDVLAPGNDRSAEFQVPERRGERPGREGTAGFLSPAVRRRLEGTDLDPAAIEGSGAGGRVTLADVEAALTTGASRDGGDETVPFTAIRRATAEHMMRSLATSAHTLVVVEVDYANVDVVRQEAKAAFRERHGASLTYLPFVARATVDALAEFPRVNAVVGDDELILRPRVDLGVAVDLDFEGLIVPVLRDAGGLRLPRLARDLADLAARARDRSLGVDDVSGGTFTITNAGGFGTLITGPIINQPQVAILSTDGVKVRPVAVPDGHGGHALGFHPVGNLALSFDHRAFDGAYASAFLARIREHLETRDWSAEL